MSLPFVSLTENNQKSKSKRFALPKCLQLTGLKRSLFPCKTSLSTQQENYVMFSYDSASTTGISSTSSLPPSSSTLIDTHQFAVPAGHHRVVAPATSTMIGDDDEPVSASSSSTLIDYYVFPPPPIEFGSHDAETEVSRNMTKSPSMEFVKSSFINEYEDVTIVKHNNSPVSHFVNCNYDEMSIIGNTYCLQSTKLSTCGSTTTCTQCRLSPSPPPKFPTSTTSTISTTTPKQHSTMLETSGSPTADASLLGTTTIERAANFNSIISSLSMLIDDDQSVSGGGAKDTFVCGSDYEATFVDDVSVQFADTVKILRDNNDDWLYVQVTSAGTSSSNSARCGYVPRTIVLDLKQFVRQLREQHYNLIPDHSNTNF